MKEQLDLIESLKLEIVELTKLRDEMGKKYDSISLDYFNTFNDLQEKKIELNTSEVELRKVKGEKIIRCMSLISVITMIVTFALSKSLTTLSISDILLLEVCTLSGSFVLPSILSFTIFDGVIQRYLIKKYPSIKNIYDKVKYLTDEINLKEQNLFVITFDRSVVRDSLRYCEDNLSKKENELELLYFDYLENTSNENKKNNYNSQVKKLLKRLY